MSHAEPAGDPPPQRYVTEIYEGSREPPELHVLHKHAMTEPEMKAGAAQLGGRGPRPDQAQKGPTMSTPTMTRPDTEPRTASNSPERLAELQAAERAAQQERADMRAEWSAGGHNNGWSTPEQDRELEAGG